MPQTDSGWYMPDEGGRHRRTWMAFGAKASIWKDLLPDVQANLGLLARTIATFEPVKMLVRPEDRRLAAKLCGDKVELVDASLDDLWIRDTGPVFVVNSAGKIGAVDLNFNGWGKKQIHQQDAQVAKFVAEQTTAMYFKSDLVGEGGGLEVDGAGTAMITESCIINPNRNPGIDKAECERRLKKILGLQNIIWLPGIRGQDITDAHTDFYARFTQPGTVIAGLESDEESFDYQVTRQHLKILKNATDFNGQNGGPDFADTDPYIPRFESFVTQSLPLATTASATNGVYRQLINTSSLGEGLHYIKVVAFRRRPSGTDPLFADFRAVSRRMKKSQKQTHFIRVNAHVSGKL